MDHTVSIVIPTYNRSHLISRAIESVIKQTFQDWELIVVDDGSTDNTDELVKKFTFDQRIKYFRKENSGAADSRNAGVARSTGKYITFLDSDDEAEPSWLDRMLTSARQNGDAVVCCGLTRFDNKGNVISTEMPKSMSPMFENVVCRFTNGGVYLMEASVFMAIGGFDAQLRSGQHTEMSYRLIPYLQAHNLRVINIFEPLVRVHIHNGARIRHDHCAIYFGSTRMLIKHEELLKKDKKKYVDHLSVAGVYGIRMRRYNESRVFFWKALAQKPNDLRVWIRWIIGNIPIIRDKFWRLQDRKD